MTFKIMLANILLMFAITIQTKAQVIVSESFENTFPPAGWTTSTTGNSNPWTWAATGPAVSGARAMQHYPIPNQANAWIFSAPYPLTAGTSYRLSYWYRVGLSGITTKMKVTLGNGASEAAQTTLLHDYPALVTPVYTQGADTFTVPASATYHFAFYCYSGAFSGALLVDSVELRQINGSACSGTPVTGTPAAPATICPDSLFTLSMAGVTPGSGVGYQWQSSPVGANTFTNINGATGENFITTQTTSKDYRCISTCFFSGLSSISNPVTVNSPAFCYCTPVATNCVTGQDVITNISFGSINNASGCSPFGYANYTSTVAPATVTAGSGTALTVTLGAGTTKYVTAWIDYNNNGVFETTERTTVGSTTAGTSVTRTINIPNTATAGLTRMRVRLSKTFYLSDGCAVEFNTFLGETEDYAVNIAPFTCSGTPAVGIVSGPTPAYPCAGTTFTLNLSGSYTGNTLQWESSLAGANNFQPIPGANSVNLTTAQTVSTDYRCRVTCTANSLFAVSAIKQVLTPAFCFCIPVGSCNGTITNVSFGSINNNSTCNGYGDFTNTVAPATVTAGTSVPISVTISAYLSTSSNVAVWIDYNKNGIFEPDEYKNIGSGNGQTLSGSLFISSNAVTGITRMRVRRKTGFALTAADACLNYTDGETEDYHINILPAPVSIYFTPFADTLYDKVVNITARITQRDVGLNTTDSLKPRLWAKKQDAAIWKPFPAQLISGTATDGNWQFTINHDSLGIRANSCDSVLFYFVAQDLNTPSNIGYLPETGALHTNVQTPVNTPFTPLGYRLKPRMRDTVYVSGGDCRYQSLTANNGLFQQINSRKLEGNLTIIVESDLVENGAFGLTAADLNGYRLTIRPADNTVRTIKGVGYKVTILKLNGVKNVTVDGSFNGTGRFLRFRNESSSVETTDSLSCIELKNGCDSITLKNLVFEHNVALAVPATAGENSILLRSGFNKNIAILNNLFTNISTFYMCLQHITSFGGNNNVLVKGNEFNNYTRAGILLLAACDKWVVDSNHFYRTTVPTNPAGRFSAMDITGAGHIIKNNYIGGQAPFCSGGPLSFIESQSHIISGIVVRGLAGGDTTLVTGNRVDNYYMNNSIFATAGAFSGISAGGYCIIKNNIIGNPLSATPTISALANEIYGIAGGSDGPGYIEIRDNIVTGIANTNGPYYNYQLKTIWGILYNNVVGGIPGYEGTGIITGNTVSNIQNTNNKETIGVITIGGKDVLVERNTVHDIFCNEKLLTGIWFGPGNGPGKTIIRKNRIYNLTNTSAIYYDNSYRDDYYNGIITGIYANSNQHSFDIVNNQVTLVNNNLPYPVSIRGIFEGDNEAPQYPGSVKRIAYNSIHIGGVSANNAGSSGYTITNFAAPVREINNNIFYNERTGGGRGHYAYRVNTYFPGIMLTNNRANNNFYVVADSLKFMHYLDSAIVSWPTWKTTYQVDSNSYISRPDLVNASRFFVNKTIGNLNINTSDVLCWNVNDRARPLFDIADDFDSTGIRSTDTLNGKTDIGAHEFIAAVSPPPRVFCAGGGTSFASNISGSSFQWQLDDGTGFVPINDNANYSGTGTALLQLNNIPSAWYGYKYRCIVNGLTPGYTFEIKFNTRWTGSVNNDWHNPANWSCGAVPDGNTDVVINSGTVVLGTNGICRSITVMPGVQFTILPGVTLTITH